MFEVACSQCGDKETLEFYRTGKDGQRKPQLMSDEDFIDGAIGLIEKGGWSRRNPKPGFPDLRDTTWLCPTCAGTESA